MGIELINLYTSIGTVSIIFGMFMTEYRMFRIMSKTDALRTQLRSLPYFNEQHTINTKVNVSNTTHIVKVSHPQVKDNVQVVNLPDDDRTIAHSWTNNNIKIVPHEICYLKSQPIIQTDNGINDIYMYGSFNTQTNTFRYHTMSFGSC